MKKQQVQFIKFDDRARELLQRETNPLILGFAPHITSFEVPNFLPNQQRYEWFVKPTTEQLYLAPSLYEEVKKENGVIERTRDVRSLLQNFLKGDFETLRMFTTSEFAFVSKYNDMSSPLYEAYLLIQTELKNEVLESLFLEAQKKWDSTRFVSSTNPKVYQKYGYDTWALSELLYLYEVAMKFLSEVTLRDALKTESEKFYSLVQRGKEYSLEEAMIVGAETIRDIGRSIHSYVADHPKLENDNKKLKSLLIKAGQCCI